MLNQKFIIMVSVCTLLNACIHAPNKDITKVSSMSQAIQLLDQGKLEDAKTQFSKLTLTKADKFPALINLGIIAIQQKEFVAAEKYFTQAYEIQSDSSVVLNQLGIVNRHLRQFKKSEDFYQKAIEHDKLNPDYWFNLGILYELYLGNNQKALQAYHKYQSFLEKPDPKVNAWIKRLEAEV